MKQRLRNYYYRLREKHLVVLLEQDLVLLEQNLFYCNTSLLSSSCPNQTLQLYLENLLNQQIKILISQCFEIQ